MRCTVVFEPDGDGWMVHIPEVKGCLSWGETLDAARSNVREALACCVDVFGDSADEVARTAEFIEEVRSS